MPRSTPRVQNTVGMQLSLGLEPTRQETSLADGVCLLHGFALPVADALLAEIACVTEAAAPRQMTTPGGLKMAVELTNCGDLGWVSDHAGYRYTRCDPLTDRPWPAMPLLFRRLAGDAAAHAGFAGFVPDACLINGYAPGTRLSLHQDRDERDFTAPIVSVSLGLPATFLLGGNARADATTRIPLVHGDVLVWGEPARLLFHGVLPIKGGLHPSVGARRINLTFRRAGP